MRTRLQWLAARPLALLGIALAAVLTVVIIVALVSAPRPGAVELGAPSDEPSATPSPTATRTPTATPSPDPAPTTPAGEPVVAAPAPAAPNPPGDAPGEEPGVISMNPGPTEGCGPTPSGQTLYLSFSYAANPGNTVDISYAYTDTDRTATDGFTLLGTGLPTSGTVSIPRPCPTDASGVFPLITVLVTARTPNGSMTAFYSGI